MVIISILFFVAKCNVSILVTSMPKLNATILISVTWDTISHGSIIHHYPHPQKRVTMSLLKEAGKPFTNVGLKNFVKDLFSVNIW